MQHCYFIYKQQTSAPDRLFRQASLPPLIGHILAKAGSGICIEGLRRNRIDLTRPGVQRLTLPSSYPSSYQPCQ